MTMIAQVEAQGSHESMVEYIAGKMHVATIRNLRAELSDMRYNKDRPNIAVERAAAEVIYGVA